MDDKYRITPEEDKYLDIIRTDPNIRIPRGTHGTDSIVKLYDKAARVFNSKPEKAFELYCECIKISYYFLKNGIEFFPGVVAAALYYMSILAARKGNFVASMAYVKQSIHFYIDLSHGNSGSHSKEIRDCENMIKSLKEVMEKDG